MKIVLLFTFLFSSTLMAKDVFRLELKNSISETYESIDFSMKNADNTELFCSFVAVNLKFTDPSLRKKTQRRSVVMENIYLRSGETFSKNLGQETFDELKEKHGFKHIHITSTVDLNKIECHEPSFQEYVKWDNLSKEDQKFLTVLKMNLNVDSLEEVEERLSSQTNLQLGISPRVIKKNPIMATFANEPMSLSLLRFFPNLESVKVRDLGVVDISRIENLENLLILDLKGNSNLKNLDSLSGLYRLVRLDLSGTSIDSLESLKSLAHLKFLDISNTKVTNLGWLLEPNDVECAVFSDLKIKTNNKIIKKLIKRSKENFRTCDRFIFSK